MASTAPANILVKRRYGRLPVFLHALLPLSDSRAVLKLKCALATMNDPLLGTSFKNNLQNEGRRRSPVRLPLRPTASEVPQSARIRRRLRLQYVVVYVCCSCNASAPSMFFENHVRRCESLETMGKGTVVHTETLRPTTKTTWTFLRFHKRSIASARPTKTQPSATRKQPRSVPLMVAARTARRTSPTLRVQIPHVELERYSVMFESTLASQPALESAPVSHPVRRNKKPKSPTQPSGQDQNPRNLKSPETMLGRPRPRCARTRTVPDTVVDSLIPSPLILHKGRSQSTSDTLPISKYSCQSQPRHGRQASAPDARSRDHIALKMDRPRCVQSKSISAASIDNVLSAHKQTHAMASSPASNSPSSASLQSSPELQATEMLTVPPLKIRTARNSTIPNTKTRQAPTIAYNLRESRNLSPPRSVTAPRLQTCHVSTKSFEQFHFDPLSATSEFSIDLPIQGPTKVETSIASNAAADHVIRGQVRPPLIAFLSDSSSVRGAERRSAVGIVVEG